jgi:hypothetical protein
MVVTLASLPVSSALAENNSAPLAKNVLIGSVSTDALGVAPADGVQIAHSGPPGALIANVTSLSFGSGVSFDTPASLRQDFR